ncbi:hypothetical protein D9615_008471 [Tricholomella constricta]|uniref:Uncharacterized protein n=1 Tax=Tricholomella constricta TaxID=117010 RepID=A0A8H5H4G1_9AGAR|nr:hypothetical protein D9615_008471 [Tricholomella constricta]
MSGHLHPSLIKMAQIIAVVLASVPAPSASSVFIAQSIALSLLASVTAMYPAIVIVLVSLQRSTVETFGFGTPVGFRSVQAIEFSSARPASPEHLSVAGNPLDGKTHVSFAAACVLKEANADRGPVGKVSATSTGIGQIDRT